MPSISPATGERIALAPKEFAEIGRIVHEAARIRLLESKITMIESRLARRLRQHGLGSYRDYVRFVQADPAERDAMVTALTTNHTHFFREGHHFDFLEDQVLAQLKAQVGSGRSVRIWSAGCSSGEEVHSIAMTLAGRSRAEAGWLMRGDVRLLATDISPPVVAKASAGRYDIEGAEGIPADYRKSWVEDEGATFTVDAELRAKISPRVLNLFADWPMRRQYDVIFCRNTMIYFDEDAKAELCARFAKLLTPGGYLFIGHSERLLGEATQYLSPCGQTIYRKRGDA